MLAHSSLVLKKGTYLIYSNSQCSGLIVNTYSILMRYFNHLFLLMPFPLLDTCFAYFCICFVRQASAKPFVFKSFRVGIVNFCQTAYYVSGYLISHIPPPPFTQPPTPSLKYTEFGKTISLINKVRASIS